MQSERVARKVKRACDADTTEFYGFREGHGNGAVFPSAIYKYDLCIVAFTNASQLKRRRKRHRFEQGEDASKHVVRNRRVEKPIGKAYSPAKFCSLRKMSDASRLCSLIDESLRPYTVVFTILTHFGCFVL